jgi:transcriptional regulator with XRE-family HTH domain
MEFKQHISELIETEGLRPLARRLGITERILTKWRTGQTVPTFRTITRIGGIIFFPERAESVTLGDGMSYQREEFSARLSDTN